MRPRNLGHFRRTEVLASGKVVRDMRVNRKGRKPGSKNRLPRVPYMCPNCHQKMTAAWARVLKRRYKREHGSGAVRVAVKTTRDDHVRTPRGGGDG